MMIYSQFGTKLMPISKEQDDTGRITIHATAEGGSDIRRYAIGDLKADDGSNEIKDAVDKLPWRVVETKTQRRNKRFR